MSKKVYPNWWEHDDPHNWITQYITQSECANPDWRRRALDYARLYSNSNFLGLDPYSYSRLDIDGRINTHGNGGRIKLNVIGSIIDTLLSNIAGDMPLVNCLPEGADWNTRVKCKRLQKFLNTELTSKKAYPEALLAFLDMCVFGTGVLYPYSEWGELRVDRVIPTEIYVDEVEACYGKPRQIHRVRAISRQVAEELFPEHTDQIRIAQLWRPEGQAYRETLSDVITLRESWHLPSSPEAGDGRRVVTIDNATLLDEPYESSVLPFIFIRWKQPLMGFWGTGIPEELAGIQIEINTILMSIQKAFHLLGNPMVFIPAGSAISKAHINNRIGVIIPYNGPTPPQVTTHRTVHPEVTMHLDRLYERAYQITGVTQLRAQGQKPSGIDSAKGIREYDDITSQRFIVVSNQWEQMFVDLAYRWVDIAKRMAAEGEPPKSRTTGSRWVNTIKWSEVDLDRDRFVINIDTSNRLPQSKAGRTQESLELLRAGAITVEEWRDLQNYEDLESNASLERASRDYLREVASQMLDEGRWIPPEEYDNLVWGRDYFMKTLQEAKLAGAPEERTELIKRWIDEATDMLEPPPPPFQPPTPGPAAGPQQGTEPQQLVTPGIMPSG